MANSMSTNLMVTDMAVSLRFYHEVIGLPISFTVDADRNTDMPGVVREGVVFAALRAGDSELMLQERTSLAQDSGVFAVDSEPGGTLTMYYRVDDVEEVVARLPNDVAIVKPLASTWYGMREIWFRDPDGYIITVGTPEGNAPDVSAV